MANKCRYCGKIMKRSAGSGFVVDCCNPLKQDWEMSLNIEALEKQLASAKRQRSKFREDSSYFTSKEKDK